MSLSCRLLSYICPLEQRLLLDGINLSLSQGEHVLIHSHDMPSLSVLAVILSGLGKQHLNGTIRGVVHWDHQQSPTTGECALLQGGPAEQLSGCCFSVRDELIFGAENIGLPVADILSSMEELVAIFELGHLLHQDPFSLSGGEQQRLLLAAVLIMKPKILILQEPFSQLSPNAVKKIAGWLSLKKNITVVYLSSDSELYTPWVTKRFNLEQGTLTEGEVTSAMAVLPELPLSAPSLRESEKVDLLTVDHLSFHYPRQPALLSNLSFSLQKGEVVALRGGNGTGKSTVLNLIQGHLQPHSGDIKFQGRSICSLPPWERAKDIGFVFQQPEEQMFSSTIQGELSYGPRHTEPNNVAIESRVERVAHFLKLTELLNHNPLDGHYQQRKTVNLGSVMSMQPALFLLDEPSAGIGEQQRAQLVDDIVALQKRGSTFLIVSHDTAFIQSCCQRSIFLPDPTTG